MNTIVTKKYLENIYSDHSSRPDKKFIKYYRRTIKTFFNNEVLCKKINIKFFNDKLNHSTIKLVDRVLKVPFSQEGIIPINLRENFYKN